MPAQGIQQQEREVIRMSDTTYYTAATTVVDQLMRRTFQLMDDTTLEGRNEQLVTVRKLANLGWDWGHNWVTDTWGYAPHIDHGYGLDRLGMSVNLNKHCYKHGASTIADLLSLDARSSLLADQSAYANIRLALARKNIPLEDIAWLME